MGSHVGLGSVPNRRVGQVLKEYEQLLIPSCFEVKHVMVLPRGESGHWKVAAAIPLAGCDGTAAMAQKLDF